MADIHLVRLKLAGVAFATPVFFYYVCGMWLIPQSLASPGAVMKIKLARQDVAGFIELSFLTLSLKNYSGIARYVALQNQYFGSRYFGGDIYISDVDNLPAGEIIADNNDYELELYTASWYITDPADGTLIYRTLGKKQLTNPVS